MTFRYLIFCFLLAGQAGAQNDAPLPRYMTPEEHAQLPKLTGSVDLPVSGITTPPSLPVRAMAEWEELQALLVTWNGPSDWLAILVEIVRAARDECRVIVNCSSQTLVD